MKISPLQLFLVLSLSSLILHPSQVTANNNNIGVPLGKQKDYYNAFSSSNDIF